MSDPNSNPDSTPSSNPTPPAVPPLAKQNQDRLRSIFEGAPTSQHPSRWDTLWKEGTFIPWDRGLANPALIDLLNTTPAPSWLPSPNPTTNNNNGTTTTSRKRARALVPGCGKGYDLALLAAHGYDAYGIEISENAVRIANQWLADTGKGEEGEYVVKDEGVGKGVMKCVLGDFFEDGWVEEAGGLGEGFDLIYDCTFLSALPPSLRAPWAARMAQLLSPDGVLICLEFPTHKPPKSGGPPWALPSVVYTELFKRPGEDIQYDDEGKVVETDRPESEKALTRIAYWKPERTHGVGIVNGDVKDRVSVWKHK